MTEKTNPPPFSEMVSKSKKYFRGVDDNGNPVLMVTETTRNSEGAVVSQQTRGATDDEVREYTSN